MYVAPARVPTHAPAVVARRLLASPPVFALFAACKGKGAAPNLPPPGREVAAICPYKRQTAREQVGRAHASKRLAVACKGKYVGRFGPCTGPPGPTLGAVPASLTEDLAGKPPGPSQGPPCSYCAPTRSRPPAGACWWPPGQTDRGFGLGAARGLQRPLPKAVGREASCGRGPPSWWPPGQTDRGFGRVAARRGVAASGRFCPPPARARSGPRGAHGRVGPDRQAPGPPPHERPPAI